MVTELKQNTPEEIGPTDDLLTTRTLIYILWKWIWVIVLVAVVVTGTAVGASLQQTPQYQASIKILVGQYSGFAGFPQNAVGLVDLTSTMAEAVPSRPIAEAAVEELDSGLTPGQVLENLSAEEIPETQFIQVEYTDPDPKRAQMVANTIGEVFSERISEGSRDGSGLTAIVWERSPLPNDPVSPNPLRTGFLAFVLGAMLGVGLAFLLEQLDGRWRSPEEAEQVSGVPTFGVIPQFDAHEGNKKERKGVRWGGAPSHTTPGAGHES